MAYPKGWPKCAKCRRKAVVLIASPKAEFSRRHTYCAEHAPLKKVGTS